MSGNNGTRPRVVELFPKPPRSQEPQVPLEQPKRPPLWPARVYAVLVFCAVTGGTIAICKLVADAVRALR
jgi:hypothetical protein